jgi:DNA-binding winged helix-turn-helix (wHTH) protein/pimeloyl-ACP methyl ester carboxylesterase
MCCRSRGKIDLQYEFNNYVIDAERVELRYESKLVDIEPQVFDVLLHLIRNQDRVVSGDELFDTVWQGRVVSLSTLTTRINAARKAIGDNGTDQKLIKTINRKGYRFIGELKQTASGNNGQDDSPKVRHEGMRQEIKFCTSGNSARLAYARVGSGPPIMRVGSWFNHLEYDWDGPVWGHMMKWLASEYELLRYDMRGIGLSGSDMQDGSFESSINDIAAVVDAANLDKFVMYGQSDGVAMSIAYAVKYPERVSKLVLLNGFAQGAKIRGGNLDTAQVNAAISLMRPGFGLDNPLIRTMFTTLFIPHGTPEQVGWLQDLQTKSNSAENTIRNLEMSSQIDIVDLLSQVSVPTLVMHSRDDRVHPFAQSRMIAAGIPGAKFVALEGNNHILLEQDVDWPKFQSEFKTFVAS